MWQWQLLLFINSIFWYLFMFILVAKLSFKMIPSIFKCLVHLATICEELGHSRVVFGTATPERLYNMSSELKFVSLQIFLCSLWFPWWKEEKADFHVLFYFGSLGHQRMEQSHVCSGYRTFNMEPTTDKGGFKLSTFICVAWTSKLLWSTVCVCVMTVWNVFYPDL